MSQRYRSKRTILTAFLMSAGLGATANAEQRPDARDLIDKARERFNAEPLETNEVGRRVASSAKMLRDLRDRAGEDIGQIQSVRARVVRNGRVQVTMTERDFAHVILAGQTLERDYFEGRPGAIGAVQEDGFQDVVRREFVTLLSTDLVETHTMSWRPVIKRGTDLYTAVGPAQDVPLAPPDFAATYLGAYIPAYEQPKGASSLRLSGGYVRNDRDEISRRRAVTRTLRITKRPAGASGLRIYVAVRRTFEKRSSGLGRQRVGSVDTVFGPYTTDAKTRLLPLTRVSKLQLR